MLMAAKAKNTYHYVISTAGHFFYALHLLRRIREFRLYFVIMTPNDESITKMVVD